MPKVVLITGASNGMGFEAAKLFAQKGWLVYAGARRVDKMAPLVKFGVKTLHLDVNDHESNTNFVKTALNEQNHVDVLINNAGYGEYGPIEEVPLSHARKQLETNLFGAADLTQLVLPSMRMIGSGRIINISSVGGNLYTPLGGWYHVTKFGLNVWSDVLDSEVKRFGIRSIIVQPGVTKSAWGDIAFENARKNISSNSPYKEIIDHTQQFLNRSSSGAVPSDLAKVFYQAATDRRPKRRYFNSPMDRMFVYIARNHPYIWRQIIAKL
ncbi:MAG: SDR family NAD(P)-dependent oxidoreductase [Lentilactobacillus hilgardii]|uniref:SDR family NAD(P)-dependent oxidoreductase n=1 Tax=Lactobacillaceae TaxID=33958 RepID=UPI0010B65C4E|nr:hypothetical protein OAL24_01631 [Oenococcus sicerae]